MQITQSQVDALEAGLVDRFVGRLLRFIDAQCDFSRPHDGSRLPADAGDRAALVEALVARARGHGLDTERGIAMFVVVALGYSRRFDEDPRVREMLRNHRHAPVQNMRRVAQAVVVAEARRG
jgi:hypothetical protein